MSRTLELTLEKKTGQIHDFSAIVEGIERISGDGSQPRSWSGPVAASNVKVIVWTTGVPGSQWVLTVDLPGTTNDFAVKYTLSSAIQKVEFET